MNPSRPDSVSRLVFELSKLPGIGERTAARLAHFILRQEDSYAKSLADAVLGAKRNTRFCDVCSTFAETELCRYCADPERDPSVICVVEKASDVLAIEQAGVHRGRYHVLHGVLSPLDGVGPENLKIRELLARLGDGKVTEVIIATNPSVEGDVTTQYLSRLIRPLCVKATRLAHGLPVGGAIEFADRQTIGRAVENRVEIT